MTQEVNLWVLHATATSARIDGMSIASAATDGLAVTASMGLKIAAKKFVHVLVVVEILGAILGATPPIVRESLERRLASIVATCDTFSSALGALARGTQFRGNRRCKLGIQSLFYKLCTS